jgi:hypothetical protein
MEFNESNLIKKENCASGFVTIVRAARGLLLHAVERGETALMGLIPSLRR